LSGVGKYRGTTYANSTNGQGIVFSMLNILENFDIRRWALEVRLYSSIYQAKKVVFEDSTIHADPSFSRFFKNFVKEYAAAHSLLIRIRPDAPYDAGGPLREHNLSTVVFSREHGLLSRAITG
jgi:gamma-glutamyltranspeptidase